MNLRSLDDRWLPRLARWTQQRFHRDASARRLARVAEPAAPVTTQHVVRAATAPAVELPPAPSRDRSLVRDHGLSGLERRFGQHGPVRLIREVPQVGFLAIALVLLVAGGTVLQRQPDVSDSVDPVDIAIEDRTTVGPEIGDSVRAYLQTRKKELADRADASPDEQAFAVISFETYQRPRDLHQLVSKVTAQEILLQVPLKNEQTAVRRFPIRAGYATDVAFYYRILYSTLVVEAQEALSYARTPDIPKDFKLEYERLSRSAYKEAVELSKDCACIFGVVAKASLRALADLDLVPGVRLVDVAPPDAELADLEFRALLPTETTKVTGGNEALPGG